MKKVIHYHTDCPFFAGCENMLVNFWSSPALRAQFDVSFSYRTSKRYAQGLKQRAHIDFPEFPRRFLDLGDPAMLPGRWPPLAKRAVMFCFRLLLTPPVLGYEIWVLRRLFLRIRPVIVHINNGGYPAALSARAAAIAALLARVPGVVMVVNNLATDYSRLSRWLEYPLDRWVGRSVCRFVTGSTAAARQLRKVLGIEDTACQTIPNGIALRQTTEAPDSTRKRLGLQGFDGVIFGVIALMQPNKGHRVLLDAIVKLRDSGPKGVSGMRFLFEGNGPLRQDLQAFVERNQLSPFCAFVGDEPNVMNLMTILDVLILPSIDREDFPNVILEAMGTGKPVIASRLAGIPEQVIDGVTGMLVEPRDPDALATSIGKLAGDPALRLQMGRTGRRRFQEQFTAEAAVAKYLSLYQSLIEKCIR